MRLRARTSSLQRAGRALAAIDASRQYGRAFDGKLEMIPDRESRFNAPLFRLKTKDGPVIVNPFSTGCDEETLQALCGLTCEAVGVPLWRDGYTILNAVKIYQLDE